MHQERKKKNLIKPRKNKIETIVCYVYFQTIVFLYINFARVISCTIPVAQIFCKKVIPKPKRSIICNLGKNKHN